MNNGNGWVREASDDGGWEEGQRLHNPDEAWNTCAHIMSCVPEEHACPPRQQQQPVSVRGWEERLSQEHCRDMLPMAMGYIGARRTNLDRGWWVQAWLEFPKKVLSRPKRSPPTMELYLAYTFVNGSDPPFLRFPTPHHIQSAKRLDIMDPTIPPIISRSTVWLVENLWNALWGPSYPGTPLTHHIQHPSENGFPQRGDPADRNHCSEKVRILKMDSPEGETPQTETTAWKKSESWKWIPPKGETPQTEIDVRKKYESWKWIPQKGDPRDRNNCSKVCILNMGVGNHYIQGTDAVCDGSVSMIASTHSLIGCWNHHNRQLLLTTGGGSYQASWNTVSKIIQQWWHIVARICVYIYIYI